VSVVTGEQHTDQQGEYRRSSGHSSKQQEKAGRQLSHSGTETKHHTVLEPLYSPLKLRGLTPNNPEGHFMTTKHVCPGIYFSVTVTMPYMPFNHHW
jgi:hypothetical protein